ncbi:MAG TPA: hypothetical protein VJT69_14185 [Pyrinomonadaceae bacterium]|nr:hypothetical protein [Pyrinomonadaceae bacterium]
MTKSYFPLLLLLLLLPFAARAQTLKVIEPAENKPLEIKGSIGDDNSFIGNIGVISEAASGTPQVKLTMYPYVLTMANGETIRPTLAPSELMLTPNTPATFQVKLTGVKVPGDYTGKISLTLPGQSVFVDVKVSASVRPALTLMTENDRLQANLVNCSTCPLARLLLSRAAFQNQIQLGFEKPVGAPLAISGVNVAVRGDQNRFQLNDQQLKISLDQLSQSQSSKKYLTFPVTIAKDELPADHYTGSIYLTVDGQTNALKVPVDFNVRISPLWPLIVLIIGILFGRLAKFMQDKGNAIADASELINRSEFRLRSVNPEDAAIIEPMLVDARELIKQDKVTDAVAAANAISARLSTLIELRRLQQRLDGQQGRPEVAAILADIRQARTHISLQQDDNAKALIKNIKDALVTLEKTPGVIDTDTVDLKAAIDRADSARTNMAVVGTAPERASSRLRSALVLISGLSNEFRSEATLFLVRPLIWLALLLGLIALGLKTLYVDNPIFGANGFADFLAVVFWGLSTDVASRTLSGLRLTSPNRPAGG